MEHTTWKQHQFNTPPVPTIILVGPDQAQITHCVLSPVGTDDEEQFGDDQVCPQVAVDGTVVCVPKRPLAAEGGKAGDQTHQSHRDADPGNHKDKKFLNTSPKL